MRVSDVLLAKPDRLVTLPPTASVTQAASLMQLEGVGAILICEDRRHVLGVLSERDLALAIAELGPSLFARQAGDLMAVDPPSVTLDHPVQNVMRIMTEQRARHVPVMEDDVVVGILSIGDVLKSRLTEKMQENAVLLDLTRAHLPM